MDKYKENNRANQLNPNNNKYWGSRNMEKPQDYLASKSYCNLSKKEQDERSRQMNPNNGAFYARK